MQKLLAALVAVTFTLGSLSGMAADKKDAKKEDPKKEAKKK